MTTPSQLVEVHHHPRPPTLENVERSLPLLVDAERLAIATDRSQRRRVVQYLRALQPDLVSRLVDPAYGWRQGWWMEAGGALYASSLPIHRGVRRLRARRAQPRVDDQPGGWRQEDLV